SATADQGPLPSPGMLARHYAPRTPTEIIEGSAADRVRDLVMAGKRVGWVARPELAKGVASGSELRIMPDQSAEYGARLYAVLHELDQLGLDRILVEVPPLTDEWLAVRDRLLRGAAQD